MGDEEERLRRIVRIEAEFETAKPKQGTGFRVGPGQVLTAQHVVEQRQDPDTIERAKNVHVSLDPDGSGNNVVRKPAKVAWRGEAELDPDDPKALDVAHLEDELPKDGLEPLRQWVEVPLGTSGRWETCGFVSASPDAEEMGREYLWGECHLALEGATYLKLTVERGIPRDPERRRGPGPASRELRFS